MLFWTERNVYAGKYKAKITVSLPYLELQHTENLSSCTYVLNK